MKKGGKIVVILVVVISIIFYRYSNKEKNIDLLLLDNIEAIAEDEKKNELCFGNGRVECGGEKVLKDLGGTR